MSNTFTRTDNNEITGHPTVQRTLPFSEGLVGHGRNANLRTLFNAGWFPYQREVTHDPEAELGHRLEDTGEMVRYRERELVKQDDGTEKLEWVDREYEKRVIVETVYRVDPQIAIDERNATIAMFRAEIEAICEGVGIDVPAGPFTAREGLGAVKDRDKARDAAIELLTARAVMLPDAGLTWADVFPPDDDSSETEER